MQESIVLKARGVEMHTPYANTDRRVATTVIEVVMRCVMCKQGETQPGKASVTLQRGETTVIVKEVPADVCENCGEYYLSDAITERILAMAEEAVRKGAEVEILRFAA